MKKGISLIVLVITIIVMIILAASVVITLSNTGIIDKASQAVQLTDEKQVQDLAALLWAEAYLDPDKRDDIENVVKEGLEEQGVTEDKWDITVSDTGVVVKTKETKAIITFTLQSQEKQARNGMTWYEWIGSEYDGTGMEYMNNKAEATDRSNVLDAGGFPLSYRGGNHVLIFEKIIDGGVYETIGVDW